VRTLVAIAWRNLWRHKRRSLITATAMAVAVAMCMALIAFTDGMYNKMFEIMVGQQLGHVQVHHPDYPAGKKLLDTVPDAEATLTAIEGVPGAVGATGRLNGFALLGGAKKSTGAQLQGLEPARELPLTHIDQRVVQGRFLADEPAREIVVGTGLADELNLSVGDEVVGFTQSADGSLGNELYTVVGLSSTGNAAMDKGGAWMHLADLQQLLVLPDQVHQITVLSNDPDDLPPFVDAVKGALPDGIEAQTWRQASPQTAELMGMQSFASLFMLGIVFAVASFGVLNTMMMSVFERTRELGVLKAIGLKPRQMVAMVLWESVFLAALAGGIGLVIGGLLDLAVVFVGFDMSAGNPNGFEMMGVRLDPIIYGEVTAFSLLAPISALVVVSLGASLWPAWRAARLQPVEAIRTE
jgi:ABC-type lipoprotein release transport system permease subunit